MWKEGNNMYSFNENISKDEYDNFVKKTSMVPFCQNYNWSNIKVGWDSFHCGLYKEKKLIGVCLILVKNIFGIIKFFYSPKGYLIDFTNYNDVEAMTKYISAHRCFRSGSS